MVILSPLGTSGTYFETGSSRLSLPSWASSTITAAVIVLVLEAIWKWVSARGGLVAPSNVVPQVTVNSPWGVRKRTTAPGIRSSLAVVSTMVCSAAWSIGLSADEPAVEPCREHAAIRRATPISKLASARMGNLKLILAMITAGVPQNIEDTFITPKGNKVSDGIRERAWQTQKTVS